MRIISIALPLAAALAMAGSHAQSQTPIIGGGGVTLAAVEALGTLSNSISGNAATATAIPSWALTTGRIPVATGAGSLGNSSISDNGTTVTTAEPLHLNGDASATQFGVIGGGTFTSADGATSEAITAANTGVVTHTVANGSAGNNYEVDWYAGVAAPSSKVLWCAIANDTRKDCISSEGTGFVFGSGSGIVTISSAGYIETPAEYLGGHGAANAQLIFEDTSTVIVPDAATGYMHLMNPSATPAAAGWRGQDANAADTKGGDYKVFAGNGEGTGGAGTVWLDYAPPAASGATPNVEAHGASLASDGLFTAVLGFRNANFTVGGAGLPSASAYGQGAQISVTDALNMTPGVCVGGGTTTVVAVSTGSAWNCM